MPTALEIKKIFSSKVTFTPGDNFVIFAAVSEEATKIKWDVENGLWRCLMLSAKSPWRTLFNFTAQNDANCKI